MILSAVYIVSPIDIIPEGNSFFFFILLIIIFYLIVFSQINVLIGVLGVVGLLDDLLIALICFLHVAALYRSVLYFRHAGS